MSGDKRPLDVYGDIPNLNRHPNYLALVSKTFHQILIKENKLEIQIKLDQKELKMATEKSSHPELNHWMEEMAQILMAYDQGLKKRGLPVPLKIDQSVDWILKKFYVTIPAIIALIYPTIAKSSFSMDEWKDKIELIMGFGLLLGGLLTIFKVKLWLRIFAKVYIIALLSLVIALAVRTFLL
jgi:hypothetical protein